MLFNSLSIRLVGAVLLCSTELQAHLPLLRTGLCGLYAPAVFLQNCGRFAGVFSDTDLRQVAPCLPPGISTLLSTFIGLKLAGVMAVPFTLSFGPLVVVGGIDGLLQILGRLFPVSRGVVSKNAFILSAAHVSNIYHISIDCLRAHPCLLGPELLGDIQRRRSRALSNPISVEAPFI